MNLFAVTSALLAFVVGVGEKPAEKDEGQVFFTLPVCRRIQVGAEVLKPGATAWVAAEEGRFYPLGTFYRAAKGGSLLVAFGKESQVSVEDGASFATRAQKLGEKSRTIVPTGGEVSVSLPGNLKPGLFFVTTKSLTACNLAGDSKYSFADTGDGSDMTVRCVTGSLEVKGRHFAVPAMHAADAFRIRSSHDELETVLWGKSGDYVVRLDRGLVTRSEIQDDGGVKDVVSQEMLDWHLSVATRVQINRAVPGIGERLSVTMMTFDSAGTMKNHFAFAEGLAEVNTGELVVNSTEAEDVSKSAAAATTEAAADVVEEGAAEEMSEDSSSDDSSSDSSDDDF